mmetsp:Transcript_22119/g.55484  ORF Transcript_22119/g.55484 Transcript_22119/m.55484 type:complete len:267 (+) Transcript_22119:208-1008(+)
MRPGVCRVSDVGQFQLLRPHAAREQLLGDVLRALGKVQQGGLRPAQGRHGRPRRALQDGPRLCQAAQPGAVGGDGHLHRRVPAAALEHRRGPRLRQEEARQTAVGAVASPPPRPDRHRALLHPRLHGRGHGGVLGLLPPDASRSHHTGPEARPHNERRYAHGKGLLQEGRRAPGRRVRGDGLHPAGGERHVCHREPPQRGNVPPHTGVHVVGHQLHRHHRLRRRLPQDGHRARHRVCGSVCRHRALCPACRHPRRRLLRVCRRNEG